MVKPQSKECSAFCGAVFLCNHLTRKECFDKKIFGLSHYCADFVEKVKAGTTLFLYDVDQCKIHGVFEATSDGSVNIIPDAYVSSGKRYPSQIRFKRIWFCKPLMHGEFQHAVQNFSIKNKFSYGLLQQQVAKLLHLFSSRNRLQLHHNPRLQDDLPGELETSSLVIKVTDVQCSPNSSSCESFRSPCGTCSSSTVGVHTASLGDKLIDPVLLVHRRAQSDISDVAKLKCSKSPLHTELDMATVTVPSNQESMHDQSTDDYIPLSQEEDTLEGIDDLFEFLKDESHSPESKSSIDSEDHTTFHQVCVRKEDGCYPPSLNSKLRADSEGRASVFSRLVRKRKTYNQGKRSKIEAFPPRSAESSNPLFQRKKQRKAQGNKSFLRHNDRMLNMPSADRLNSAPASNRSFVWRRSTEFSGGKQSEIQTCLGSFVCGDGNKWDVSNKQTVRYDTGKKSFIPKGFPKLTNSCDKGLNVPTVFAGVHDSSEVNLEEEMRTPSSNFKRHANNAHVKGWDHDFYSGDVEEEVSDENFKEKSVILSSKDTHTQLARPYLETNVLLQDEQQQGFQGRFEYGEDAACDSSLILESSTAMDKLAKHSFGERKTLLNDETQSHVAGDYLGTETSLQQKETQSIRNCYGVVSGDKMLLLGKFETMNFLADHVEDCENKKISPSDENDRLVTSCHLETEIPLLRKQTPDVQNCSEVVNDDEVLVSEIPEVMYPKSDRDYGNKGTSLGSCHREVVCHLVKNYHEVGPSDAATVLEGCGPLNNFPHLRGDSAKKTILFNETSGHVSTGHQDTILVPHDEHYYRCCGDTSHVPGYSTVDKGAGDGGCEHKNSFDQKDDETLYLVTGCKGHRNTTNTFSCNGSHSFVPTDGQESNKVMLLGEQHQNFQSNSNSVHSFAVSSEGSGKSGISADRPSVHQAADLLGTNSESRTSFINESESRDTFSASALGSEDADHNINGSEAYAEPPILQHDPGEAMKQP
ncbi:hypothetical protein BS78_10G060000 [Paspalum vaginatum]|nr:hypothetical protein BS78_10G060000 [Paspalum vaginatum]